MSETGGAILILSGNTNHRRGSPPHKPLWLAGRDRRSFLSVGVAMIRKQYFKDVEAVAAGRDPKGVIRDPERNRCIDLPTVNRRFFAESLPLEQYRKDPLRGKVLEDFRWHYGQPEDVRREFRRAMRLE